MNSNDRSSAKPKKTLAKLESVAAQLEKTALELQVKQSAIDCKIAAVKEKVASLNTKIATLQSNTTSKASPPEVIPEDLERAYNLGRVACEMVGPNASTPMKEFEREAHLAGLKAVANTCGRNLPNSVSDSLASELATQAQHIYSSYGWASDAEFCEELEELNSIADQLEQARKMAGSNEE